MENENLWKIFNVDKSVMILTDVPPTYRNGDGVYNLCHHLQKVYGYGLCSIQKFDNEHDKLEDFNIILKTAYNLYGNRLICAHLFEYDPKTETLKVDNGRSWKIAESHEFTYQIQATQIKCIGRWDGLRKHILWTMGRDTCWAFWGDAEFGVQNIIPLDRLMTA